jgi:hypothetical protein
MRNERNKYEEREEVKNKRMIERNEEKKNVERRRMKRMARDRGV